MGYIRHDTIVCTSWKKEHIKKAHNQAIKIFDGMVSEIVQGVVNGQESFFIPPDGSKEGRTESTEKDNQRSDFRDWLRKQNLFIDWVEISFGGDEPDENTEITFSGNYEEKE